MSHRIRTALLLTNEALRVAIGALIARMPELSIELVRPDQHPDLAIATTADVSPDECRLLLASGCSAIILAAVPTDAEGEAYAAAGVVSYVPMDTRGIAIGRIIAEAVGTRQLL